MFIITNNVSDYSSLFTRPYVSYQPTTALHLNPISYPHHLYLHDTNTILELTSVPYNLLPSCTCSAPIIYAAANTHENVCRERVTPRAESVRCNRETGVHIHALEDVTRPLYSNVHRVNSVASTKTPCPTAFAGTTSAPPSLETLLPPTSACHLFTTSAFKVGGYVLCNLRPASDDPQSLLKSLPLILNTLVLPGFSAVLRTLTVPNCPPAVIPHPPAPLPFRPLLTLRQLAHTRTPSITACTTLTPAVIPRHRRPRPRHPPLTPTTKDRACFRSPQTQSLSANSTSTF